jgi:hypothetical protein
VKFVEFIEVVGFVEFQWRCGSDAVQTQWRYVRNPNAKDQMANKVQMPKFQGGWGLGLEIGEAVEIHWGYVERLEIRKRLVETNRDTVERLGSGAWSLPAVCLWLTGSDWLGTGDRVH